MESDSYDESWEHEETQIPDNPPIHEWENMIYSIGRDSKQKYKQEIESYFDNWSQRFPQLKCKEFKQEIDRAFELDEFTWLETVEFLVYYVIDPENRTNGSAKIISMNHICDFDGPELYDEKDMLSMDFDPKWNVSDLIRNLIAEFGIILPSDHTMVIWEIVDEQIYFVGDSRGSDKIKLSEAVSTLWPRFCYMILSNSDSRIGIEFPQLFRYYDFRRRKMRTLVFKREEVGIEDLYRVLNLDTSKNLEFFVRYGSRFYRFNFHVEGTTSPCIYFNEYCENVYWKFPARWHNSNTVDVIIAKNPRSFFNIKSTEILSVKATPGYKYISDDFQIFLQNNHVQKRDVSRALSMMMKRKRLLTFIWVMKQLKKSGCAFLHKDIIRYHIAPLIETFMSPRHLVVSRENDIVWYAYFPNTQDALSKKIKSGKVIDKPSLV